jgi:putative transposase
VAIFLLIGKIRLLQRRIAMKKNAKKSKKREAKNKPVLPLRDFVKVQLFDTVVTLGMQQVYEILEEERTALCGPRYLHEEARTAVRAGHTEGILPMGGRTVAVLRPRVRTSDGRREIPLNSWEQFRAADPLTERAVEQMVLGVSTRKYGRSLEPLPAGLEAGGTSKSSVSRRFVQGTQKKLEELLGRDLSSLRLTVIMIDGIHFADHVILVALGVDEEGRKTVLGLHEGATENSAACKALLRGIVDRGVSAERAKLFVLDGGKGLKKAVAEMWGKLAVIQRCQIHKMRNVLEHLPPSMEASVRQSIRQAYRIRDAEKARRMLLNLSARLDAQHPGAARSLKEGLDETLTVMGLGIPETLERMLSVTNAIENLFGTVRVVSRRVKRWGGGKMILRWSAAGLLEAERGFRKIRGHKGMPSLVAALKKHERKCGITRSIEVMKETA